jgi:hypothetical protein
MPTDFSFNYPNSPYGVATSVQTDISCIIINSVPSASGLVFSISPSLPAPLIINPSNGTITGFPTFTNISPNTAYTIDASYSISSLHYNTDTTIILGINFLPAFFYTGSPYIKQIGIPVDTKSPPIVPVYVIGNLVGIVYTDVSPVSLISSIGLTLNSGTGIITGIPTALIGETTYTIRANNVGVLYDTTLVISIQNAPSVSYPKISYNLTQGVPVSIMPVNPPSGLTYSIDGCALPLGLSFNTSTGEISGTPTLLTTFRQYSIIATNIIGSVSTVLILNVIKIFLAPPVTGDGFSGGGACLMDPATAMRRKAEILKYKNNSSQLSKSRLFSLIAQGKGPYAKRVWGNQNDTVSNPNISGLPQQGNTIICNSPAILCAPTSSSDVPGPIMNLCYNPQVPLIGYVQPNRKKVDIGFKWPQKSWSIGDMGFPVGKAGNNNT